MFFVFKSMCCFKLLCIMCIGGIPGDGWLYSIDLKKILENNLYDFVILLNKMYVFSLMFSLYNFSSTNKLSFCCCCCKNASFTFSYEISKNKNHNYEQLISSRKKNNFLEKKEMFLKTRVVYDKCMLHFSCCLLLLLLYICV